MRRAFTYFHTLRYLKWQQLVMQVWYRLKPASAVALEQTQAEPLRDVQGAWQKIAANHESFSNPMQFHFLNHSVFYAQQPDWQDAKQSQLWLYNLHYFDFIWSKACLCSPEKTQAIMLNWVQSNPPVQGIGWDSYPISLRIVNWVKWSLSGFPLAKTLIDSLWLQAHFLSKRMEYHILANHFFENCKALLFAGLFFQGEKAQALFKKGQRLFIAQLHEQVLEDGAHYELSPMYHAIMLVGVLDVIALYRCYGQSIPAIYLEKAQAMLQWLSTMVHPDGGWVFFNDTALGIAPEWRVIVSYAKQLGITWREESHTVLHEHSGYAMLRNKQAVLFIDAADIGASYQPGHAHADTLSFELSLFGQRWFVNSGISTYTVGKQRQWQRSSALHNTLVCDHQNSSHVWSAFRVAKRAKLLHRSLQVTPQGGDLTAAHNGYRDLKGSPVHERRWQLSGGALVISDRLLGRGKHHVALYFHLHPDIEVLERDEKIQLVSADGRQAVLTVSLPVEIKETTYFPEFGKSVSNKTLCINQNVTLPWHLQTTISWEC